MGSATEELIAGEKIGPQAARQRTRAHEHTLLCARASTPSQQFHRRIVNHRHALTQSLANYSVPTLHLAQPSGEAL